MEDLGRAFNTVVKYLKSLGLEEIKVVLLPYWHVPLKNSFVVSIEDPELVLQNLDTDVRNLKTPSEQLEENALGLILSFVELLRYVSEVYNNVGEFNVPTFKDHSVVSFSVDEVVTLFESIRTFLLSKQLTVIEVEQDYYWDLLPEQSLCITPEDNQPKASLGQISHDIERTLQINEDPDYVLMVNCAWIAAILKYASYRLSAQQDSI